MDLLSDLLLLALRAPFVVLIAVFSALSASSAVKYLPILLLRSCTT